MALYYVNRISIFLSVARRRYHQRFRCTTEQNGSWAFITNRVQIILIYKHLTYTYYIICISFRGAMETSPFILR